MLTDALRQQIAALSAVQGREAFALFMEQGTGKTWVTLAESERLFAAAAISGLLVVALNGVHRNWIEREIPQHLSLPHRALLWESSRAHTRSFLAAADAILIPSPDTLRILAINVESFSRPPNAAIALAERFLASGRILMAVDESDTIKTPSATRTRVLWRLGRRAAYRRILTGTPVSETPLSAYAQFKFLSPILLGFNNFTAFKAHFAEWTQRRTANGREYPELIRYRNLDELKRLIDANSFSVRKRDCLDIPEKVYQVRPVELPEAQRKIYRDVARKLVVELKSGTLTLAHALTRLTRLAQVAGGFLPTDDEESAAPISSRNPKVESLLSYLADLPADVKTIVWCRFVPEARAVATAIGAEATRYWGEISNADRAEAVTRFQSPSGPRVFVGTQRAGGRGLTLTAASQVVYFSNSYSYTDRIQSEDRPHRHGQRNVVTYTDLVATGTIDEKLVSVLAGKKELSELFAGGTVEDLLTWLEGQTVV